VRHHHVLHDGVRVYAQVHLNQGDQTKETDLISCTSSLAFKIELVHHHHVLHDGIRVYGQDLLNQGDQTKEMDLITCTSSVAFKIGPQSEMFSSP
jgi:hypothetical protein